MAYATPAELSAYTGQALGVPTEDQRLLDRASEKVDAVLVGAYYATNAQGMPTDVNHIAALKNATCAQVEYWRDTGDELDTMGDFRQVTIGSLNMTRADSGRSRRRLAPRAIDHLRLGGLLPITPVAW